MWKQLVYGTMMLMILSGSGIVSAETVYKAVIGAVSADWTSYTHSIVEADPVGGPRNAQLHLQAGSKNFALAAFGEYFYRIERMNADNITKFSINAPNTPIWQYSTLDRDDLTTGNPGDMTFVNQTKAYVFRYGKQTAWIVNPSAVSQAEFKIGELDLSSYADQDGIPEMQAGVIADGKLFVVLQRLDRDNEWIPNTAYIAVFDAQTDQEIDTQQANADGVKGIPLPIKNPLVIQYIAANHTIYVQGVGKFGSSWSGIPPMYDGGIIALDPITYSVSLIIDDGDDQVHPYGLISGMAIVSPEKGYFVGYDGWNDNTLYPFNPSNGSIGDPIPELKNIGIAGMDSGLCVDKNLMVWVSNQTDSRVEILNSVTDTIDERINTELNPFMVVFAGVSTEPDTPGEDDGVPTQPDTPGEDSGSSSSSGCFINSLKLNQ